MVSASFNKSNCKIVYWALLSPARAWYLLAKSAVDGGPALNVGSYKWQATS
jgi:hypothetical protein